MDFTGSRSDWLSGAAALTSGLGTLTFVVFPFAVPFLLLTIVAVLPLALPLIAVAAVFAILKVAWLGIRAAARGVRRLGLGIRRPVVARGRTGAAEPRPC